MDETVKNNLMPFLSELDPAISSEGALDPLGLYAIADSMGVKIAPGVRERQSHPRYLTAIAVAANVCSNFDNDTVAADGVSPPWQVFEWYMVEGLVRTQETGDAMPGLPGKDKVRRCIQDGLAVSARTYLKTSSVFGFHGVYRLLARTLNVIDSHGRLGGTGFDLLSAWEKEQGLEGFSSNNGNPVHRGLLDAVKSGLEKGSTDRNKYWNGWQFFNTYLHPYKFGSAEGTIVLEALLGNQSSLRCELIRFLMSGAGQTIMRTHESGQEQSIHLELKKTGSIDMQQILNTIIFYEHFARLLQDAFDDCLKYLSDKRAKVPLLELAELESVVAGSREVHKLLPRIMDYLQPLGESIRFREQFSLFNDKLEPADWVDRLLEHHRRNQAAKPPNGKAPWVERFDDGSAMVRSIYRRELGSGHDNSYVHAYRTQSLWSFLKDLGRVMP